MSNPRPSSSHGSQGGAEAGHGHTAGGDMNLPKIVVIGVVSLALFAIGVIWADRLQVGRERDIARTSGNARAPADIGKPEIGIVDQVPFSIDHRIEDWRKEHAHKLSHYGWVDRGKGIVRIPIEQAMQKVVESPPDIPEEGVPPNWGMPAAAPAAEKRAAGKAAKRPGPTSAPPPGPTSAPPAAPPPGPPSP